MAKFLDPHQMSFWSAEERALWERLSLLVLRIYTAGGVAGERALPANLRVLVNWDLINQKAIDYLKDYRLRKVGGILEVTRRRAIQAIEDWVRSGEPLPALEARLSYWFSDDRAKNIAVTSVTDIYSEANQQAWKTTGFVTGKRWNTVADFGEPGEPGVVCPLCKPLHNFVVPIDSGFSVVDGKAVEDPEGVPGPSLHPRCRCWLLPVVDVEAVGKKLERIIEEA